jgi:hypothetical protein
VSTEEFVGLDPDTTRALAGLTATASETAGHVWSEASHVIGLGQLDAGDLSTLCAEIEEELDLLARLLRARATEIELADAGVWVSPSSGWLNDALWASLTDGQGEGITFEEPDYDEQGGIPLGASVAARALAEYLRWHGDDGDLDPSDLSEMLADESLPPELRAAAQYFLANHAVWGRVTGQTFTTATADDLDEFATTNAALAVVAAGYPRFETAADDDGLAGADGYMSWEDAQAVINDDTGNFSREEKEAVAWLLEHGVGNLNAPWESWEIMTWTLAERQVFADDPELAASWLDMVAADPGAFVINEMWYDEAAARSWLDAAMASTDDPARQTEIVLAFAGIYEATKPEDVGPLTFFHDVLDMASWVDPTQLADAVNAGIYVLEGDDVNAAISAGAILLPIGGGKAIRLTRDLITGGAMSQRDEVAAKIIRAIEDGSLTQVDIDRAIREFTEQFGDEAGAGLSRWIDDVAGQADNAPLTRLDLEGQTAIDVYPPGEPGRRITDIDLVQDGVLWETKTATGAANVNAWVERHVNGQMQQYLDARQHLAGWEDAPIGLRFTEPGIDAAFRRAVEDAVDELRRRYPGVDIRLEWPA